MGLTALGAAGDRQTAGGAERLVAAGAAWSHVVKLTIFVVDSRSAQAPWIAGVGGSRFEAGHVPALSLVGVAALADPQWLVEVEATATVPTGRGSD